MAEERIQRRLAAILAADVVGYSRLVEADEAGAVARLRTIQTGLIEPAVARDGGRVVKLMGDGVLIEFASAVDAVRSGLAIQTGMDLRNTDVAEHNRIEFRIGINVGDVIIDGEDIHGEGVNIAARLEAMCAPGEVYVSAGVREHVEGKLPTIFEDLGERTVKNITRPVRVYWVRPEDRAATPSARPAAAPTSADKTSIAVLAFDNMSDDAEQEYFSDGISEDIIMDLSNLSELHVIARNSSFVYKKRTMSIPEIARELGVRYVLEGSVRKAGGRIRVNAQLIDSTSGGHLWAERFDRQLTDIFEVQDELTREIVTALKLTLSDEEQVRQSHKATTNLEAYDLYLRGREPALLHTKTGGIEARGLMGRAIAIDPDHAAARAAIAFSHVIDFVNGWSEDPEKSLETGLEMARKAVEIDDQEPHALFALAVAYLWSKDLDQALVEAQRCLSMDPNSADGHMVVAHTQIFLGNPAKAIEMLDAYMQLDPHYTDLILQFMAEAHISLGQYDEAIVVLKQRQERNPEAQSSYALLAACYGHLGRIEEGRQALDELLRIDPDFSIERRRQVLPFRNPADFERRIEGMRKSGLAQ